MTEPSRAVPDVGGLPEDAVRVEAFRWRLAPGRRFESRFAVLATDRLRQSVVHGLDVSRDPEDFLLGGHEAGEATASRWGLHAHAHWLWTESGGAVQDLALWVPAGLPPRQVRRVVTVSALPRYQEEPVGYRGGELLLRSVGPAVHVLGDLGAGISAAAWASTTPMLTRWHLKEGADQGEHVRRYLDKELRHRLGPDAPTLLTLEVAEDRSYFTRRWDRAFPFHSAFRIVDLVLSQPVSGPLCLGSLSHFGFGRMEPR